MITIYDFESVIPGIQTFSPYVLKVRIALNYKKLPHRSVFIKNTEFQERAQELGMPTNDVDSDEVPRHKVPTIHDDSTGQFVTDSTRILAYLDRTYPNTPSILSPGNEAAAVALDDAILTNMLQSIYPSIGTRLIKSLDRGKAIGFRAFVEGTVIGMTVEEYLANEELERKHLKSAEEGFSAIDKVFRRAGLISGQAGGKGASLTYAEVAAGATLFYIRAAWRNEEAHWKCLLTWDGGRWGRLYETLLPYTVVPEE